MKAEVKKCAVCGKKFTPKVVNSKCCSDNCRKEAKRQRDADRNSAKKTEANEPKRAEDKASTKKNAVKKTVKKVVGKAVEKIALPKGEAVETVKHLPNGGMMIALVILVGNPKVCTCKKGKAKKTKK